MTILKGDCGGLGVFPTYFVVCHTGTIYLRTYLDSTPPLIYNAPSIKQGYGAVNTLAMLIRGSHVSFYANGQLIQTVTDSLVTHDWLVLISDAESSTTDVVYNYAKIWNLSK